MMFGCKSNPEVYLLTESWDAGRVSGEVITLVTIESVSRDEVVFIYEKSMPPFGEYLKSRITGIFSIDKYSFDFLDPWSNHGFGTIQFFKDHIVLSVDCDSFSDQGKNIGRLYGFTKKIPRHRGRGQKVFK
ncbi:MAG: hypothetical protein JXR63_09445 [Spirochaetales bacterium]|nr:hypothetical protein [Spirochaetales bacterium]